MNPLTVELVGVLSRWLLNVLGAYLVAHHVLTTDQADRFSNAVLEHLLLALPAAAALAWSLWAKYRSRLRQLALNELPAGSSDPAIKARMQTLTIRDVFRD